MLISDATPTLHDCIELYGLEFDSYMADYPIWDEAKREWLNERIREHFEYRQIAQETPAKHGYFLHRTMADMMPSLNPMFKVLDSEIDILSGADSISTSTAGTKQTYSALPQSRLSTDGEYATNATENETTSSSTVSGRTAPIGEMLTSWASSVNNALYIVYNGLEPLYMQVFPDGPFEEDY